MDYKTAEAMTSVIEYLEENYEPTVEIKLIKLDEDAILPTKAHDEDNCWDIYSIEEKVVPARGSAIIGVGLKLAYVTPGFGFVFRPRSGLGFKHSLQPALGEIDNGYRGELGVKIYNFSDVDYTFKKGDKMAQFKIEKVWKSEVSFTDEVTESTRGEKGFGSSGR